MTMKKTIDKEDDDKINIEIDLNEKFKTFLLLLF